jgi:hypothetical protein
LVRNSRISFTISSKISKFEALKETHSEEKITHIANIYQNAALNQNEDAKQSGAILLLIEGRHVPIMEMNTSKHTQLA